MTQLTLICSLFCKAIMGVGFIARDILFINIAGPLGYQAVALRSSSDHSNIICCL